MTTEFEDPRLAQIRVELGKTEAELYEELACTLSKDALPSELWRRGQEIFLNIVDESRAYICTNDNVKAAVKAHPVVPGSSTYRGGGRNLKRGWVSSFRVP
jgi:hypothetical protein